MKLNYPPRVENMRLCGKIYKHSNRKWRLKQREGRNVKSHGYLKNVDSIEKKRKKED